MKRTVLWIIVILAHVVIIGGLLFASKISDWYNDDPDVTPPPDQISGLPTIVTGGSTDNDETIPPPIIGKNTTIKDNGETGSLGGSEVSMDGLDSAGSRSYTVQKGDSAWKIARKYGLSYYKLLKANNLNKDSKLKIGQKLVIPNK